MTYLVVKTSLVGLEKTQHFMQSSTHFDIIAIIHIRKKLMRFFLAINIPLTTYIFWWKLCWQLPRPFWEGDPCLLFFFSSFSVDQGINQNRTDNCIKARREDRYTVVEPLYIFHIILWKLTRSLMENKT